jgi:hypothetical protein
MTEIIVEIRIKIQMMIMIIWNNHNKKESGIKNRKNDDYYDNYKKNNIDCNNNHQ